MTVLIQQTDPAARIVATDMINRLFDFVGDFAHDLATRRGNATSQFAHDQAADDLVKLLATFLTRETCDPAAVVRAAQLDDLHAGEIFGTSRVNEYKIVDIEDQE